MASARALLGHGRRGLLGPRGAQRLGARRELGDEVRAPAQQPAEHRGRPEQQREEHEVVEQRVVGVVELVDGRHARRRRPPCPRRPARRDRARRPSARQATTASEQEQPDHVADRNPAPARAAPPPRGGDRLPARPRQVRPRGRRRARAAGRSVPAMLTSAAPPSSPPASAACSGPSRPSSSPPTTARSIRSRRSSSSAGCSACSPRASSSPPRVTPPAAAGRPRRRDDRRRPSRLVAATLVRRVIGVQRSSPRSRPATTSASRRRAASCSPASLWLALAVAPRRRGGTSRARPSA